MVVVAVWVGVSVGVGIGVDVGAGVPSDDGPVPAHPESDVPATAARNVRRRMVAGRAAVVKLLGRYQ